MTIPLVMNGEVISENETLDVLGFTLDSTYCYLAISWTTHYLLSQVTETTVMVFDSFTIVVSEFLIS